MTSRNGLEPTRIAIAVAATMTCSYALAGYIERAPAPSVTKGATNSAPFLIDNFRQGTPVILNESNPEGDPVSDLEEVYRDDDGDRLAGAAVITNSAMPSEGEWQYSTNAGATWTPIPTAGLSDSNALLLAADWIVRFVPSPEFVGAAGTLAGRVWDGNGTQVPGPNQDLTGSIGGSGGFSMELLDATVTVIDDRLFFDNFE